MVLSPVYAENGLNTAISGSNSDIGTNRENGKFFVKISEKKCKDLEKYDTIAANT